MLLLTTILSYHIISYHIISYHNTKEVSSGESTTPSRSARTAGLAQLRCHSARFSRQVLRL